MPRLNADAVHPITLPDGSAYPETFSLRNVIDHPRMEVGAFSYFTHAGKAGETAAILAPYLYPFSAEKLTIGKFVQIARGVLFITSSANHPMKGISTFPFRTFRLDLTGGYPDLPFKNTTVGHDVWLGHNATIMPGVTIGSGAIIAAGSVVASDVPPYAIVGGNPARLIRARFKAHEVDKLLQLAWWDWDTGKIERHIPALESGDLQALLDAE